MCRSKRNEIDLRYPNEATAPQIAAQSPSDNSRITISDAPLFSGTSAVRTNRSDRDGPAVMWRLLRWAWRSAASASRCPFRETGLAGVRLTLRRCACLHAFVVMARYTWPSGGKRACGIAVPRRRYGKKGTPRTQGGDARNAGPGRPWRRQVALIRDAG